MGCAVENTKSHHTWEEHYLPEFTNGHPPEQMGYCVSLATGALFNLHWDPIVLLQASLVETNYTCNRACSTGKKGESGNPGLTYSHSVHLLTPHSPASPGQHVERAQYGHIPKAAAILTSKDRTTRVILFFFFF